jgi:hypothetical protein
MMLTFAKKNGMTAAGSAEFVADMEVLDEAEVVLATQKQHDPRS